MTDMDRHLIERQLVELMAEAPADWLAAPTNGPKVEQAPPAQPNDHSWADTMDYLNEILPEPEVSVLAYLLVHNSPEAIRARKKMEPVVAQLQAAIAFAWPHLPPHKGHSSNTDGTAPSGPAYP